MKGGAAVNELVSLAILLLAFIALGIVFCISGGIHILALFLLERVTELEEIRPKHRYYV